MKLNWKREMLGGAILAAMAAVAFHYYPDLPARMPSHIDIHGKVNEWTGKNTFFLLWAAYLVVPYLLITFLPFIDPLKHKIEPRFKVLLLLRDILLVVFAALFLLSINAGVEGKFSTDWFGIAVGFLLIMLGNYMPKFPQNWFVGIKTPWTISSEVVWKKTHILGGWLFALTGVVYVVFAGLRLSVALPSLLVVLVTVFTFFYSFYLYRKLDGTGVPKGAN
jgi:immunity protein, SdpI family